jgi:hypothetical protein
MPNAECRMFAWRTRLDGEQWFEERMGLVRAVRFALVTGAALVALGTGGCGPPHHQAEDTSGVALTGDKGEIKGVLTNVGGPYGRSPQPIQGQIDVYTLGGNQVADISPVSAWDFELKPGTYNVQATVNRSICGPIKVKIVKGTVQVVPLVCSID